MENNEERCSVCGWKMQKRACGMVCKNWNCYKYWKFGKTIEEGWRTSGTLGRIWLGNKLWLIEPDRISDITTETIVSKILWEALKGQKMEDAIEILRQCQQYVPLHPELYKITSLDELTEYHDKHCGKKTLKQIGPLTWQCNKCGLCVGEKT